MGLVMLPRPRRSSRDWKASPPVSVWEAEDPRLVSKPWSGEG